jgi:hypothetical protein
MKHILTLFLIISICSPCFAAAIDMRISDGDGHVLKINPVDGAIYLSTVIETPTLTAGAPDKRISDGDSHVISINSNGSLNAKTN